MRRIMSFYTLEEILSLAEKFEQFTCGGLFKLAAKVKARNRGKVVFPAESSSVKDNKDHFPINDADQARNALARANQYSSVPKWYKGSLQSLVNAVARAVKKHYPSIEVSKAARKPGKG